MINDLFYKHLTVKNLIFLFAIILITVFMFKNIDVALMIFVAFVISCSLNPLVTKMEKKIKRPFASALVICLSIILFFLCVIPILYVAIYEISTFADTFAKHLSNIDNIVENNKYLQMIGINQANINEFIGTFTTHMGLLFDKAMELFQGIGSALVYVFITTIFTYFFLADKDKIKKTLFKLFPSETRVRAEDIFNIISSKIAGYIVAQIYSISSVAIVMTIGLLLFKVKYALLLGLITAVLDIIPVIGPAIAFLICLIPTHDAGMLQIIGVVVSFIAAQLVENNVIRPYAFSKLLNIHPILVFAFLYIGAKYFGIIGALFAPAIAATVCVLIEELYIKTFK